MHDDKKLSSLTSEKTEFKREIGVFGGISIIGGIMIGSGIFYLGSYVLQRKALNNRCNLYSNQVIESCTDDQNDGCYLDTEVTYVNE